jgi:replicative DNA helicase
LTIEELTNAGSKASNLDEVANALLAGDAIVLEAEPGAGKTTTLLQIASRLAQLSRNSAPLIVPLAERLRAEKIVIHGDSKLVIEQCFGSQKIKKRGRLYETLAFGASEKPLSFTSVLGTWIPRRKHHRGRAF